MSDFKHNDMNGSLFKNDQATGNQPPYTGICMINGQEYRVAAWVRDTKDGTRKFFSLKFSLPQERKQEAAPVEQGALDDDVPF